MGVKSISKKKTKDVPMKNNSNDLSEISKESSSLKKGR